MVNRSSEDIEFESARLAHASAIKAIDVEVNMVSAFGNAAMRAPGIAAAGGIAALLGFYSANSDRLRGTPAVDEFNSALLWFFGAVLACVAAPSAAYVSQSFFVHSKGWATHHFERPFVRDSVTSKWLFCFGTVFQVLAVLLTIGATLALVFGGVHFMDVAAYAGTDQSP
ncbi:hypothetical protein [Mesorhizobium sp. CAU 1732]|uniref:hypothetical protein n=1 Tax=Mesorhizobium sp. CAU 1732 TaxID=3140358 RepID=UPI003260C2FF